MLDEYKNLYIQKASNIKDWDKVDKNYLCKKCLEFESDKTVYDEYMAALICRYWNLIPKFYSMSTNLAEPEDCYNWLIDSIMYALKHRQWENPDSPIFGDPKGPDKVINRCMKSSRLIFYQFKNRKKRRKEYQFVSIDELKENLESDYFDIEDPSAKVDEDSIDIEFFIEQTFNKKEYFLSFILDQVFHEDVFESEDNKYFFSLKKLVKRFKDIDSSYAEYFSDKYSIDKDSVIQAIILAKNIPESKIKHRIEELLLRLRHSKIIKDIRG